MGLLLGLGDSGAVGHDVGHGRQAARVRLLVDHVPVIGAVADARVERQPYRDVALAVKLLTPVGGQMGTGIAKLEGHRQEVGPGQKVKTGHRHLGP